VIGRLLGAATGLSLAIAGTVGLRDVRRRGARRLLAGPRRGPGEAALAPAVEALGGEVVRLRARDGVRLAARWLPAVPRVEDGWRVEPHDAILLLHGYSGSIAPDLVEYGPFLRHTAGVLGLDFRGHGDSDDGASTFGLQEVEDVAGALAWLGERGITRVALVGTSMGGITAIAAVAVLGDGSLPGADADPAAPAADIAAPRPRIDGATEILGADPRATEPARMVGLVEPVPLLLIHGEADRTVPIGEGRRLAALAGPSATHWVVPGAEHSGGHATAGQDYGRRVTDFLRMAFERARAEDAQRTAGGAWTHDMMRSSGPPTDPVDPLDPATRPED
jgi:pimeloyl-ACP methyl ester carboxylesterase